MMRLSDPGLDSDTAQSLSEYQQVIDALETYDERVASAKKHFSNRNRRSNRTFRNVRQALAQMCGGEQRCVYCEDSVGDEVEHIQPKDLYPCLVFVWTNYVYACGRCNGGKNNKFAVVTPSGLVDVTRSRGAPVVPPLPGAPGFLNPRTEDPLAYCDLDLQDTFYVIAREGISDLDRARADFTIETLKLNRDVLAKARFTAYGSYRARLHEYIDRRDETTDDQVEMMVDGLKSMPHPTVWAEMKRQYDTLSELQPLFASAPEALEW